MVIEKNKAKSENPVTKLSEEATLEKESISENEQESLSMDEETENGLSVIENEDDCRDCDDPPKEDIIEFSRKIDDLAKISDPTLKVESLHQLLRFEMMYIGPIPPPEDVKALEEVHPGAAEILFRLAEKDLDNKIACDKRTYKLKKTALGDERHGNDQTFKLVRLIIVVVFAVAIIIMGLGGYFIFLGKDLTGLALLVPPLIGGIYGGVKILVDSKKSHHNTEIVPHSDTTTQKSVGLDISEDTSEAFPEDKSD